jgi:hypothetical protein
MYVQIAVYQVAQFGPLKFMSMVQFALSVWNQAGVQPNEELLRELNPDRYEGVGEKVQVNLVESLDAWNNGCGSSGFRGLCAVGIIGDNPQSVQLEGKSMQDGLNVLTKVVDLMSKDNSATAALKAFKFTALDGMCQDGFVESIFGISAVYLSVPTVLVYSPAKQRYSLYQGNFAPAEIKTFY